ncbi:MAG TPA: hypothetical protein VK775_07300 [Chthoniobacterales bacterium]|jgi:hypothetical protein|nr:hypothetical protein [Chthoniobacterales bacterium]
MNSMSQAVSAAVANPVRVSKSSKRENRKPAVPEVKAPVAAAPVVVKPVAKIEKVQTPETIFNVVSREKLQASRWGLKLAARKTDEKVHLDHTSYTLQAILSSSANAFTISDVVRNLDRPAFEGAKPKSDKLLRSYLRDCIQTLVDKTDGGLAIAK